MRLTIGLFALLALLPTSALAANGRIFTCLFDARYTQFLAEKVVFTIDDVSGRILVNDARIKLYNSEPIEAERFTDNSKKTAIGWRIDTRDKIKGPVSINYRLAYFSSNGKAKLSTQTYFSEIAGGTCIVKKGEF